MQSKYERPDQMKFCAVRAELKADDKGTIEGYGAVFGNVDRGRDVIQPGAFADSLKSDGQPVMLWQHDSWAPIGIWTSAAEDDHGLRVKGNVILDVQAGKEAHALVKAGAIKGLSIGYRTLEASQATVDGAQVRVIEKAELWEVSIVTFPMNELATIDAAKAAQMDRRELERALLSGSKPSRTVVEALTGGGFKGVQALRDSGDEGADELLEAVQAASLMNSLS